MRKKFTSTKKPHFTEGWIEFKDKKIARSVADMLNAQPIGGKKGSRWKDDVWTMKYLPKFKWNMLTEQVGKCRQIMFSEQIDDAVQHMKHNYIKLNYGSSYRSHARSNRSTYTMSRLPEL